MLNYLRRTMLKQYKYILFSFHHSVLLLPIYSIYDTLNSMYCFYLEMSATIIKSNKIFQCFWVKKVRLLLIRPECNLCI